MPTIQVFDARTLESRFEVFEDVKNFKLDFTTSVVTFDSSRIITISNEYQDYECTEIISRFDANHGYQNKKKLLLRLGLLTYLNAKGDPDQSGSESQASIEAFINTTEPALLVEDKAFFIILANLPSQDLLLRFIERCTLKMLVLKGFLIEWMFSNFKNGRSLRNLVQERFNETFHSRISPEEMLDPMIFIRLINYKYTPKLLKEPYSRSIFLRMLRVPLLQQHLENDTPIHLEIAGDGLDEDYDTGHLLKLGKNLLKYRRILALDIKKRKRKLESIQGINLSQYQLYTSVAPIQLSIGSDECIRLFRLLERCPGEELNDLLRPLIYLEWKIVYPFAFSYMLIYWTFACLCYAFFGFFYKHRGLGISIIATGGLLFIYEILSLRKSKAKYLKSYWNIIDFSSLIATIVLVPLLWHYEVQTKGWAVGRCVIMTIIWIRALTWLKIFRSVRYLITMVLSAFYDMIAYLTILVSAVFGLSFIWRLSFYFPPDDTVDVQDGETYNLIPSFFSSLQTVTMIILGNMPNAESDGKEFSVIRFLVAVAFGIILALALTNLLIAIISQTYSTIEESKKIHDLREVIGLIIDFNEALWVVLLQGFRKNEFVLSIHQADSDSTDVIPSNLGGNARRERV